MKKKNKIIGLCHGVFDVLHHGHIKHFEAAKKKVDILVVSLTDDKYVKLNGKNLINSFKKRYTVIKSLKVVDQVIKSNGVDATDVIKKIKPNYYFKGEEYKNFDYSANLKTEKKKLKFYGGKIIFIGKKIESSTKIINNIFRKYSDKQIHYLNKLNKKIKLNDVKKIFDKIKLQEVSIIGEPIIDVYQFCKIKNITNKDPAVSLVKENVEKYDGGAIFVAKILSNFCKKVNFCTYGKQNFYKNIKNKYKNIKIFNYNTNKIIQEKTRFIANPKKVKLLQVTNLEENIIERFEEKKVFNFLKKKSEIVVCDFGIGMFSKKIVNILSKKSISLNVQNNSINYGFNNFTKYKKAKYICLDLIEWQLGTQNKKLNYEKLNLIYKKNYSNYSVTLGANGSFVNIKNNNTFLMPVLVNNVVDTTGSGDTYFAITTLLQKFTSDPIMISLIGNAAAGLHSLNIGNSKIINSNDILVFLKSLGFN